MHGRDAAADRNVFQGQLSALSNAAAITSIAEDLVVIVSLSKTPVLFPKAGVI